MIPAIAASAAIPAEGALRRGGIVGRLYRPLFPAYFHGQDLDIAKVPADLYWLVHRANSDYHLREEHYGDDAASLLVRIAWKRGSPTVTPIRACHKERC
ncbi:MAG TPA: hypothetical protein VGH92_14030 [Gaiellaceae bacterium]